MPIGVGGKGFGMFRRAFLAIVLAVAFFVGGFAAAPAIDMATTLHGPIVPAYVASGMIPAASIADALSPKAKAYDDSSVGGCSYAGAYCWVQFCSAYGLSSGTIYASGSRQGLSLTKYWTGYINSGCNNWASFWIEPNTQMYIAWAGDPVYWISDGQIGT